jgi:hypothetical protein
MSAFLFRFTSALPLLALLACKLGKDDEQTARPLPAPEPASTTPPSRPAESEPRTDRPREPPRDTPPRDTPPSTPATPKPTATTPAPTATATATADAAAPAPTATALADAAAPAPDKMTQCLTKCQGSLSACLSKPVPFDAGVPSLESMAECKKAFEDCRTACTP